MIVPAFSLAFLPHNEHNFDQAADPAGAEGKAAVSGASSSDSRASEGGSASGSGSGMARLQATCTQVV